VTTLAVTSIGATGATLNGNLTPNGMATTAWFEWGTNSALTGFSSTPTQSVGSGTTSQPVNAPLTGLSTGSTYYYRVAASNGSGTTKGSILSFIINNHRITTWPDNRKGAVSLGFDDGCPSHLSLGVPALNARGLKGTFFLVTGDGSNPDWPDWNAWRNAAAQGHEIGSHTMTHADLTAISLSAAQGEMSGAKAIINAEIPAQNGVTFAYPFGYSNASIEATAGSIYIGSKDVSFSTCTLNSDPFDFTKLKGCSYDDGHANVRAGVDAAEAQGKWVDVFTHTLNLGADGCWGEWNYSDFTSFLDYLPTKDLYVGTFGSLVKYSRERVNATLTVVSSSSSQIVLSLTDTLDNAIYNRPLTIRSELPSGWISATVQQGGSSTPIDSILEGTTRVIYFNAVPDGGLITLRSP
jgi:oligosaccharide reducing-end xylanase